MTAWSCTRCGSDRWVAASLTGPVEYGGRAIRQCVPCGHYSDDPVPERRAKTMQELGRDMARYAPSVGIAGIAMQRQIRDAMQRSVPVMREFDCEMQRMATAVSRAFRVPLRLLLGHNAERERRQVHAMQRWARRRGRRKGR